MLVCKKNNESEIINTVRIWKSRNTADADGITREILNYGSGLFNMYIQPWLAIWRITLLFPYEK